jgi:hypothetical protein
MEITNNYVVPNAGKITKIHMAVCYYCHTTMAYYGDKKGFISKIKGIGWRSVAGRWVCERHVKVAMELAEEDESGR